MWVKADGMTIAALTVTILVSAGIGQRRLVFGERIERLRQDKIAFGMAGKQREGEPEILKQRNHGRGVAT